jgi:hypothetical protein
MTTVAAAAGAAHPGGQVVATDEVRPFLVSRFSFIH